MVAIVILTTMYLIYAGMEYYNTPFEERFYHPRHDWFKPSGAFGHGLGIIGTLMILVGVVLYIARKRYNFLSRLIRLKYLLEFHIFLCTLGPILVLFHTAFKFGGIVSIAFWSMVAVVLSGVIGRFIYIQIPRTIEGRALSLNELKNMKTDFTNSFNEKFNIDLKTRLLIVNTTREVSDDKSNVSIIQNYFNGRKTLKLINKELKAIQLPKNDRLSILKMVKNDISLSGRIARLQSMQRLFKYWHVAHLPFALIMLIIVIIHIGITLAFGYKWIF
ncbi:MAG: hypothetical protein DWQ02_21805 [Bacteroidetes bacterium]|nr:MAG: hypothetical protein DWQ02_21805 [Bacteroidota bacterium]